MSMCAAGILGVSPPMPSASNRNSKRRWRRTASRRHNAPELRQVTILARESLTTLPRFVASLSRRAAKRPFPAVGLNVAEGWGAVIRAVNLVIRLKTGRVRPASVPSCLDIGNTLLPMHTRCCRLCAPIFRIWRVDERRGPAGGDIISEDQQDAPNRLSRWSASSSASPGLSP